MQLTIDDLPAAIRDAKKRLRADLPGYAATFRELEGDIARQVDAIRRAHAHGHDVIPRRQPREQRRVCGRRIGVGVGEVQQRAGAAKVEKWFCW